tara:strand:+ start:4209 stop:4850 length:642 start_codon:yes stop_codon:yes gene_type:complete
MTEVVEATSKIDIEVVVDDKRSSQVRGEDGIAKKVSDSIKGGKGDGMGMGGLPLGIGAGGGLQGMKGMLGKGKGAAMNPIGAISGMFDEGGMIGKHLMKILPKMLVRAIPIIGTAALAIELVPMIIKAVVDQLTKAGAPFDKRFKRMMAKEQNAFFNREEQRRRQLGLSPVIITSVTGFANNGGNNTIATLKQVKEQGGISSIGLQDKAIGLK